MEQKQQLGGTRQSTPLEDEMSYPLTGSEFLLIKENLIIDKLTNWESFLLTTGLTSLISGIIFCITGKFENIIIEKGQRISQINISQIIIVIVYFAIAFGSIIAFFALFKKKSKNAIERLDKKISTYLNIDENE